MSSLFYLIRAEFTEIRKPFAVRRKEKRLKTDQKMQVRLMFVPC